MKRKRGDLLRLVDSGGVPRHFWTVQGGAAAGVDEGNGGRQLSHPDFQATTLKLINHDKMWVDKNFWVFIFALIECLADVCKCSQNQINPPTPILHLLAPNS